VAGALVAGRGGSDLWRRAREASKLRECSGGIRNGVAGWSSRCIYRQRRSAASVGSADYIGGFDATSARSCATSALLILFWDCLIYSQLFSNLCTLVFLSNTVLPRRFMLFDVALSLYVLFRTIFPILLIAVVKWI
jgi:hypothetical protein